MGHGTFLSRKLESTLYYIFSEESGKRTV